jgi:hypothetical protein
MLFQLGRDSNYRGVPHDRFHCTHIVRGMSDPDKNSDEFFVTLRKQQQEHTLIEGRFPKGTRK